MTEMIELEDQEELIKNEQDIETAAYKEAFDHFDWNHSGRIPTSVKSTNKFSSLFKCNLLWQYFFPIRPWYLVKVEPKKRLNLFGRNFSMPCGGLDRIRLMSRWRKLDFFL